MSEQNSDEWQGWRWFVFVGLIGLALTMGYRVATEGLDVALRFVKIYERSHAPITQETTTDWPVGDTRQAVRTEREDAEQLENWLDRHDAGVIGTSAAAKRRTLLDTGSGK